MGMRRLAFVGLLLLVTTSFGLAASNAELYFASDKNGENRVTNIQEGTSIWIVVDDPDENKDCDVRDKIWTDVKLIDPKTGAYIIWKSYKTAAGDADGDLYDADGYLPYKGHYPGASAGWLGADYLEETGPNTDRFVSRRPFQIGTREDFFGHAVTSGGVRGPGNNHVRPTVTAPYGSTHVVDQASSPPDAFKWGAYFYAELSTETKGGQNADGDWMHWAGFNTGNSMAFGNDFITLPLSAYVMPSELDGHRTTDETPERWLVGRFENMDTLIGMIQDPDDETDVAVAMMKIDDTEAEIVWDREVYPDGDAAARIVVTDPDENLDCNYVEYVPVFIIVNPGSWNPTNSQDIATAKTGDNANNFCMLKRTGGVDGSYVGAVDPAVPPAGTSGDFSNRPMRWFNIYNSEKNDYGTKGAADGRYYLQYPKEGIFDPVWHGTLFDTTSANGVTAVSFYAQETSADSGVFQLNLNSILDDLGFNSLRVYDVLVAYYLDPNDEDDFKLACAYIGEKQHSVVSFSDASRQPKDEYWLGRDSIYVQVVDSNANELACCPERVVVHLCDPHDEDDGEFWVLDETSSSSSVFFSNFGMELLPVWDALGLGLADKLGGYQLVLDNWTLEAFNEDEIYVRYNDVQYVSNDQGMQGLGDFNTATAYSGPRIERVRVANDVSFDLVSIGDTQVYRGESPAMYFLGRDSARVQDGYVSADCVFIEVVDPDQNEDALRRERIDAFWDGNQNIPFGPVAYNSWQCGPDGSLRHPVNALLGDTNIFDTVAVRWNPDDTNQDGRARIYVLNPRNGRWAPLDLMETETASGDFVSVVCVDLANTQYPCVPSLGALPGDTIVAFYMDPSNHSDSAMIQVKVAMGGGTTPPSQKSTTTFVNASGGTVTSYTDADLVYVKVVDASHSGDTRLENAITINGQAFSLAHSAGWAADTFMTAGLDLAVVAGDTLAATYRDPSDPSDTSSATASVVASKLEVTKFFAGPNPAAGPVTFGYKGTGVAKVMSVVVYDLSGRLVWALDQANTSTIVWDAQGQSCGALANGAYIYVITASDGTTTFPGKGVLFINR